MSRGYDNIYEPLLNGHLANIEKGNNLDKNEIISSLSDEDINRREKLKCLLSFIFLNGCLFISALSVVTIHERHPEVGPLPDIVLDNFQLHKFMSTASEIIVMILFAIIILFILFHKHRFTIYKRLFFLMGLLHFYRSITVYVTVLPVSDPAKVCLPKENSTAVSFLLLTKRAAEVLSVNGMTIFGKPSLCGDYIFSGHTVFLVNVYLFVKEYSPHRWWLLRCTVGLLTALGVIFLLIGKQHYTIDCILAYYVANSVFSIYHTIANNENLRKNGSKNAIGRVWWFPIFHYLEQDIHGVIPYQLEWPFPRCPKWFSRRLQFAYLL